MRPSCRAIIFKDDSVILIYREKNNKQYYVFPGGKLEENETKEECVVRECKEELGIKIKVKKYIYDVRGKGFRQYFFLCEWIEGELGTGDEEEYNINRIGGIQIPMLIKIKDISKLNVVSPQIVKQLLLDINKLGLELDTKVKQIIED